MRESAGSPVGHTEQDGLTLSSTKCHEVVMTTSQHTQRHMDQQSHEATEDDTEVSTSEGICKLYYSEVLLYFQM